MMERLLFSELLNARDDALANIESLNAIQDYFRKVKRITEQKELDAITTHFTNNPPDVIHGYAREDTKFPCWAVILQSENETTNFLGDEGGIIGELSDDEVEEGVPGGWLDPDDPDAGADELASIYTKRYLILTYSKHPDVTIAYYHICRFFMTRARGSLKECGELVRINFSGADLFPDPRYIPSHLHARQMTIEVEMVERVVGPKPVRAFQVKGLHFPTESNETTTEAKITTVELDVEG